MVVSLAASSYSYLHRVCEGIILRRIMGTSISLGLIIYETVSSLQRGD